MIDTTYVYNLNPEKNEWLDYFYNNLPIMLFLATYIGNYLYEKYKVRVERNETKSQLRYSLQTLLKATQKQADYIDTFKAQFETKDTNLNPIGLDVNLNNKNTNSISPADLYKIFITKSSGKIKEKSEIYNKFNYVVTVVEKAGKHLENDMNRYIRSLNDLYAQFNAHNQQLRLLMNEWISRKINKTATDNEIKFIDAIHREHKKLQESGEMNNIFYAMEHFHLPLLNTAIELNIEQFANLIPLGVAIFRQLEATRKSFHSMYSNLENELRTSNEYLNVIINSRIF
jgi:hypothetical protein